MPLFQHVMVGRRLLDLFASSDVDAAAGFVKEGAPVNHELVRIARDDWASTRDEGPPHRARQATRSRRQAGRQRPAGVDPEPRRRHRPPRRGRGCSRRSCSSSAASAATPRSRSASTPTCGSPRPRSATRSTQYVEERCRHLDRRRPARARLPRVPRRPHPRRRRPPRRACCRRSSSASRSSSSRGLCKVVFATETLALGINMPARTVVIEKLSKWNGETHADITPGEYTQLTGRAGRRGLDVEGHGVVLWQPGMNPREVAGLASTRTYPLRSSFRPSYNMAVNLVHQFGRERARASCSSSRSPSSRPTRRSSGSPVSCARARTRSTATPRRRRATSATSWSTPRCAAASPTSRRAPPAAGAPTVATRPRSRCGRLQARRRHRGAGRQVRRLRRGRRPRARRATATRGRYVVTVDRQARRLALIDFPVPVESLARLKVPKSFNGRNPQMRRDLATPLRSRTRDLTPPSRERAGRRDARRGRRRPSARSPRCATQLKAHPCHQCPDREDHARWAERWFKLDRDAQTLKRRVEQRTNTVARRSTGSARC